MASPLVLVHLLVVVAVVLLTADAVEGGGGVKGDIKGGGGGVKGDIKGGGGGVKGDIKGGGGGVKGDIKGGGGGVKGDIKGRGGGVKGDIKGGGGGVKGDIKGRGGGVKGDIKGGGGGVKGDIKGGPREDDGCKPDTDPTGSGTAHDKPAPPKHVPDDSSPEDSRPSDSSPDDNIPDDSSPVDIIPDDIGPEDSNPDENRPENNPATDSIDRETPVTHPTGGGPDHTDGPSMPDDIKGGQNEGVKGSKGSKCPIGCKGSKGSKGPKGSKGHEGSNNKGVKGSQDDGHDVRFPVLGGGGHSGGVAGAGVPVQMGDNSNDKDANKRDKEDERERIRARSNQRAPVVCFLRGDGFERSGVRRYSLRSLPIHMCTHFIYSYVETDNKSGDILYRRKGNMGEKTILRALGRIRHDTNAKEIKTLVSYGAGAHVQSLLNRIRDDNEANKLVNRIKSMLETFGLDGINFHLEGPGPLVCKQEDIRTIVKFIKNLRHSVNKQVLITAQLPACRDTKCNLFMSDTMARYLDYLFLITFDYRLDDLTRTRLTSGLYRYKDSHGYTTTETETCLGRWIDAGVPKHKIVPGLATYGRSFTLDNPAYNGDNAKLKKNHPLGYAAEFSKTDGYMNYLETCNRAGYMKWTRQWVPYAATPYIYHKDQWVSYDDTDSADVKVKWFRDRSLGGVFIWSLGEDDYAGNCKQDHQYPMVTAAWKVMKDYWPIDFYRARKRKG
ncbi:endochitinase-like [Dermacentor andersoni]|uniref:endochitinase-like n=1 Tax=Dermacentor andersoni TaxID=34620 RepID=UPI0024166C4F|nr:endochitinase-like [Dermacentor andersoni]XP_054932715.1 endochitinase-like [Dermacentor andersoni]